MLCFISLVAHQSSWWTGTRPFCEHPVAPSAASLQTLPCCTPDLWRSSLPTTTVQHNTLTAGLTIQSETVALSTKDTLNRAGLYKGHCFLSNYVRTYIELSAKVPLNTSINDNLVVLMVYTACCTLVRKSLPMQQHWSSCPGMPLSVYGEQGSLGMALLAPPIARQCPARWTHVACTHGNWGPRKCEPQHWWRSCRWSAEGPTWKNYTSEG